MDKNKLLEKAKRRTREADIDGEPILVKIYPENELKKMLSEIRDGDDKKIAEILSRQFVTNEGETVYSPEFILSEECTQCFISELAQLFMTVNQGMYKKKLTTSL